MVKTAAQDDLPVVENIMSRIHDEDPSYWPFGLETGQFNGGLYLVKKSADEEPAGFVGWQKFDEGGRDVGYYAIGILPEHRQKGFAKSAVAQVIREIGSECDEVKAMVMAHNDPSKALARSLSIPMIEKLAMEKEAMGPGARAALQGLLGLGTGSATDMVTYGDDGVIGKLRGKGDNFDAASLGDFALNALVGGAAGSDKLPTFARFAAPVAAQATTIGFANARNARQSNSIAQDQVKATESVADATRDSGSGSFWDKIPKSVLFGAGGLGVGALGLLAYSAKRKADNRDARLEQEGKGRVKITLPTSQKGDNETEVQLPFDDLNLSKALRGRLSRDTRRRLYAETKARTKRRPKKGSPTDKENKTLDKEREDLDKAAAMSASLQGLVDELEMRKQGIGPAPAPQGNVPTPPQLGQNPAMRMQQQDQAVANSIQPAPDANPAIMKAEQAAMQAEQQSQMQAAEMEQQAQAAQMQQQQQFQEQMMKAEQEKEVLKMQLEKEKALSDLKDAAISAKEEAATMQEKATADAGKGEGTQAQQLISNRLDRLGKRVGGQSKAAAAAAPQIPPLPEGGGKPPPATPPGIVHLKPHMANKLNRYGGANGMIPNVGIYRHSYGKMGDWVYDLFRKRLMTPDAPGRMMMSPSDIQNSPDKMGLIASLYGRAGDALHARGGGQYARGVGMFG